MDMCREMTESPGKPEMPGGKPGEGYGDFMEELSAPMRLLASREALLLWYEENKRDLPWRRDRDAYRIWISEIMLQQTRAAAVIPYYFRFMEHFPSVLALASKDEEELLKCWEGLGYYSRARNLKKTAVILAERYGGKLPASYRELLALPGIGSYTAGAIASIAYDIPAPAVDGNVLRVLSRVTGSREDILKASTKKKMEELASVLLIKGEAGTVNQALIETGAVVCIPNGQPICAECPFFSVCAAREKGLIGQIPVKAPKKKRKIEEKTVLLLRYKDKIAIRKRSGDGLLASLYEFVSLSGKLTKEEAGEAIGTDAAAVEAGEAKHIFSHVEWHMCGYLIELSRLPGRLPEDVFFAEWEELKDRYPIPNAFSVYRKFLEERFG